MPKVMDAKFASIFNCRAVRDALRTQVEEYLDARQTDETRAVVNLQRWSWIVDDVMRSADARGVDRFYAWYLLFIHNRDLLSFVSGQAWRLYSSADENTSYSNRWLRTIRCFSEDSLYRIQINIMNRWEWSDIKAKTPLSEADQRLGRTWFMAEDDEMFYFCAASEGQAIDRYRVDLSILKLLSRSLSTSQLSDLLEITPAQAECTYRLLKLTEDGILYRLDCFDGESSAGHGE